MGIWKSNLGTSFFPPCYQTYWRAPCTYLVVSDILASSAHTPCGTRHTGLQCAHTLWYQTYWLPAHTHLVVSDILASSAPTPCGIRHTGVHLAHTLWYQTYWRAPCTYLVVSDILACSAHTHLVVSDILACSTHTHLAVSYWRAAHTHLVVSQFFLNSFVYFADKTRLVTVWFHIYFSTRVALTSVLDMLACLVRLPSYRFVRPFPNPVNHFPSFCTLVLPSTWTAISVRKFCYGQYFAPVKAESPYAVTVTLSRIFDCCCCSVETVCRIH